MAQTARLPGKPARSYGNDVLSERSENCAKQGVSPTQDHAPRDKLAHIFGDLIFVTSSWPSLTALCNNVLISLGITVHAFQQRQSRKLGQSHCHQISKVIVDVIDVTVRDLALGSSYIDTKRF